MRTAQLSWNSCSSSRQAHSRPRCRAPVLPPLRCQGTAAESSLETAASLDGKPPLVVKSIPPPRTPAAPPQPVPIEHSSAFLLRSRRDPDEEEGEEQQRTQRQSAAEPFTGNAVKWALMKADESLDEIEENPPAVVKSIYDLSRGPVGEAASKGVTTVAKVTWQVGTEAVKAAAPVGKWALQQSFKLAVTAMSKGLEASSKKENKSKK